MATYRYPNDFQSPVAGALSNLVSSIASLPGPEERALKQAQLEQIRTATALNQSKIADAQREAAVGGNLAGVFRRVLTPVEETRPTPDTVGPMPEVPVDKRFAQALPDLVGSLPPAQLGQFGALARALAANAPGTTDPTVTRAMLGAGDSYNSTPVGAGQERERKYDAEADKNLRFERAQKYATDRATQAQMAIAERQAVSDERKGRLVYDPKSPTGISWHAPGTSAHGLPGVPPQASQSLATKAEGQLDAMKIFESNLLDFENLAKDNPNSMGFTGDMVRMGSGVASQAGAAASALGLDIAPYIQRGREALAQSGIKVPDATAASQLDTYGVLIPRLAAKAFGESTGAGFSNQDAARYAKAFGESPIANLQNLQARISVVKQMLANDTAVYQSRANKGPSGLGTNVTTPLMPTAPAPAAAPAPVAQPKPVQKWGRDSATGKPVPVGP